MLPSTFRKTALVTLILFLVFSTNAQNQALDMSGAGNEVNVTYSLNTGGFTVEQWIYIPTAITQITSLVNQTNSNTARPLDAYVTPTGQISFWIGDDVSSIEGLSGAGTIVADTWHHVAIVYDPSSVGTEGQLFIDGVSTAVTTSNYNVGTATNDGQIRIGNRADGTIEGDPIYYDEVRIWNIARDGAAIAGDYNQELIGNEAGLDVYLRFENNLDDDAFVNLFQDGSVAAGSIGYIGGAPIQENNYALDFDATDQYVDFGTGLRDNLVGLPSITVEAWVYRTADKTFHTVVGNYNSLLQFLLRIDNNKVSFFVDSDIAAFANALGSTDVPINTWTHIAGTWDGTDIRVFINGVQDGIASYSGGVLSGDGGNVTFGGNTGAPAGEFFQGQIDEVRVWNLARSESQINAFKDQEVNALMPGLFAYYDLSDGPNTSTVSDLKGGSPGLLTSMDAATDWIAASHGLSPAGPLDTGNPDVSITSSETDPTAANPLPITITFSEEVVGFDLSDIDVINGSPSNLNTADNIVFTADITPSGGGLVQVDVSGSMLTDLTGNFNNPSNSFSITYDVTPPVIQATTLSALRNRIFVEFNEGVYGAADGSTPVDVGDFSVNTTGGAASVIINSLNVLSPSEVEFDITISGLPDGAEVVDVTPIATSVYDGVGNVMSVTQDANETSLVDQSALSFDGIDDYVRVPTDAAFENQNYSVEAWVNISALPTGSESFTFVSKGTLISDGGLNRNGYTLLYGDLGGGLAIALGQFSSFDTEVVQHLVTLNLNTWYHVAGTYDGTTMRLYLDGVEVATNASLGANDVIFTGDNLDLKIGAMEGVAPSLNHNRGMLDEVRVWNYARSAVQIGALYDEELSGSQTGLVAYYDFNDAAGSTLTELVSSRNGTLTNMDLTGATGNWASGGTGLAPADATPPILTFAEDLQTIGTTVIGGTIDDNFATIEVSLDGGTTRTPATNNGDGSWEYDMAVDPNFGGEAPYTVNIYAVDQTENEGSVSGNVTIDIENALSFDGADDYVQVDAPSFLPNDEIDDYTFEGWVYLNDNSRSQGLFGVNGDEPGSVEPSSMVSVTASGELRWTVRSSENATNFVSITHPGLAISQWYHIAASKTGADYRLYLDGQEVGSSLGTAIFDASNDYSDRDKFLIGTHWNVSGPQAGTQLDGEVDEVRYWSVGRTQEQINADAYTTLAAGTGLVASYDFNLGVPGSDNSGITTLTDLTVNTNDGILNGPFTLSGLTSNWVTSTAFDNDVFAPVFLGGYPLVDNITTTGFDITVQLNEPGTYFYVVVPDGATAPNVDDVRAGTGFGGTGQVAAGNINVTTPSTDFVLSPSGLASGTDYDLYVVAQDDEGSPNVQNSNTFFDVTTITPPLAPTNLIAYYRDATSVDLEWNDVATDNTDYLVEWSTSYDNFDPNIAGSNLVGAANAVGAVVGIGADQGYFFRVTAINGNEDASSQSTIEFATTESFPANALQFDGINDIVTFGDANLPSGTSSRTVEMWVNGTQQGANTYFFSYGTNAANQIFAMGFDTSGRLLFTQNGQSFTSSIVINDGWHHVAISYDGATYQMYLDGVADNTSSPATNTVLGGTATIGGFVTNSLYATSTIDEVKVWDIVKSDFSDRFASVNLGVAQPNLVAYFPLDEGAGTFAVDRTSNTNDGSLAGFDFAVGSDWVVSDISTDEVVANTSDAGPGSLREAINYANANPGTTISFNIPTGPYLINLATALPDITAAGTIIDGTTLPSWTSFGDAANMVEINGSSLGLNEAGLLINNVANVEIYGLILSGFTSSTVAVGAIEVSGDGADNVIIGAPTMGNIFHNMNSSGIAINHADFVTIQSNRFGTLDGTTRSEIGKHGIYLSGTTDNVLIGGNSGSGEGNQISGAGNGRRGIVSIAQGANFVIQGNLIGTDITGTASLHNEAGGVDIGGAISFLLGGSTAGQENIISGNNTDANAVGVIIGTAPTGSIVNNIVGLASDGTASLGNGGPGIILNTTSAGVVVDGNIISSNGGEGITSNTGFGNVDIINNIIGFDQTLTNSRPNAAGIVIDNGSGTNNRFGYKDNPNVIANNAGPAIDLTATSTGNSFVTNEIYDNLSGIVLAVGANNSIAPPTIDAVTTSSVSGTGLDGDWIHLYQGDGAGQGQVFLDSALVSGGSWNVTGLSLLVTDEVVATATDAADGTSAFSIAASIPPSLVTNTNDVGAGSLRDAITYANANPGTTITFDIPSAPYVINLASALPQITAANTIIDGTTLPVWAFGSAATMVTLNGSGIGGNANGININAADVEVYGLIFTAFDGNISNGAVYVASDAADNAIIGAANKGNIIHGTIGGNAIYIVNGDNATIQGNRIGTLDGTNLSAIGDHGIATTNEVTTLTIGGDFFTGEGNLISGAPANRYGMNLFGSGGSGLSNVTIRGNKIGTNEATNGTMPNTLGGINILGTNSAITIGGPSPGDLNIISGNADHGIIIQAGNTFDIDGNYIGLQSDGSTALGNGGSGIRINGTATNINIGTNSQNIIAENVEYGIVYDGNTSSNTALGTNIFSCNQLGGIGYGSGPLTPGATIDDVDFTTASVTTAAADGSSVYVYIADDGCSNNQGVAFVGAGLVAGGQAVISGGFAPSAHYVALVEDLNGFSEFSSPYFANFVMVTNTNDTGTGSFRAAIDSANMYPGASIYFNIPGSGPWNITLATDLPDIAGEGTIIDATTQPFWDISTANIPRIIGNASINNGLNFTENFVEVYGLHISDFNVRGIMYNLLGTESNGYTFGAPGKGNIITGNGSAGIQILTYTGGGAIQSNYIGILPDGTVAGMANQNGISLGTNGDNVQIGGLGAGEGNVISNNTTSEISLSNADFAIIQGNILGLTPDESAPAGAANGVNFTPSNNSTVEQNVIGGHTSGIRINSSNNNTIIRNNIGVASDGFTAFGNNNGIFFVNAGESDGNIIGSSTNTGDGNIIANSINTGIIIDAAASNGNEVRRNSIFLNSTSGIAINSGAQNGIAPPSIDPIASASTVTGTGTDGDEIDLYLSDGTGQGDTYLGSATVSGGTWSIGTLSLTNGEEVVATTTNATDGTSEFSISQQFSFAYPVAEGAGTALSLDGIDDYISFPPDGAYDLNTGSSVEMWIQPNWLAGSNSANPAIISVRNGTTVRYSLHINDALDEIGLANGIDPFRTVNYTFTQGEWHHVAFVFEAVNTLIYIDGEFAGTLTGTTIENPVAGLPLSIGWSNDAGNPEEYFTGGIDEVRIWNTELTESTIREWLAKKVTNTHPEFGNLAAYYRFDDAAPSAINNFTGGLTGAEIGGALLQSSGAHLGDASFYEYTYTAGSGRNLGDFFAQNLGTANLPLHIYQVNQTPANNSASGFNAIDDVAYYGVFSPGQTYQARYSIIGVTSDRRILSRADLTDPAWVAASGFLGTEVQDDQMISRVLSGSAQYVTATSNSPYPVEIDGGSALSFDGNDDVLINGVDLSGGAFTIETWFKTAEVSPYLVVLNENGSLTNTYALLNLNAGQVRFVLREPPAGSGGTVILSTGTFNDDQWHHATGVYDGVNTMTLYVDGIQVAQNIAVGSSGGYNTDVSLGKNFPNATGQLIGELDEVRIWSTALSETEIRDHMIGRIDPDVPAFASLVSAYKFDDGDPNTAFDLAGSNDGVITGATRVISGAPQGQGSIYSYVAGPAKLSTSAFGEDIILNVDDASQGVHGYLIGGAPDQTAANGFNALDQTRYYGVFAPGNPKVDVRMDYNNGGSPDTNRRILYRKDATDNAPVGGWERVSGLINSDPTTDSVYAYNVAPGEFTTATLNPPSSYPILSAADPGSALDFDGTDDQIDLGNISSLSETDAFTIEGWFNQTTLDQTRGMFIMRTDASNQIRARTWSDGNMYVYLHNASTFNAAFDYSTVVTANGWFHFAMVFDGNGATNADRMKVYIDGVEVSLTYNGTVPTSAPDLSSANFLISDDTDGDSMYWLGLIDEFRIWNASLTAGDIIAFANTTDISAHPNYSDMLAYYKFDDGTGSTAVEDVFSNNDGTLINMDENTDWVASGALTNPLTPPNAPSNFVAYASSATDVTFEWTDNASDETGFLLESADDFAFTTNVQTVNATIAADAVTTTENIGTDISKFYRLTATNGAEDATSVSSTEFATTSAFPGYALDFTTQDNEIDLGDPSEVDFGAGDFTIETWYKVNDPNFDGFRGLINKDEGAGSGNRQFLLSYDNNADGNIKNLSFVYFTAGDNGAQLNTPANTITDSNWHHIAVVRNGNSLEIYVDGILEASGITVGAHGTMFAATKTLGLGGNANIGGGWAQGQMDEVRFWNYARTQTEIQNNSNLKLNGNETGLVAYYPFDEGSGNETVDQSVNAIHGINTGTSQWVLNTNENALNFAGDNDYVSVTRTQLPTGLTFEAWIQTSSTDAVSNYTGNAALSVIGDVNNDVGLSFGITDGRVVFNHFDGSSWNTVQGNAIVNDNTWHHIAATHEQSTGDVNIYVDGILDITGNITYDAFYHEFNRIGSSFNTGTVDGDFFDGSIDEVRIWNDVVSGNDIRAHLYSDNLSGHPSVGNLVLHYNFNQGDPGGNNSGETAVFDQSSSALDGTLNGFALTGAASNFVSSAAFDHSGALASSVQATNISPSNIMDNSVDISWTNGDGQRRIVAMFEGIETEMPIPSDNLYFHADANFGGGDIVDGAWYAVYNGYGNSTTVNGLTAGTDYTIAVLEVNGPPTFEAYNSGADVDNPVNFTTTGASAPEIEVTGLGVEIVSGDNTPDLADDTDFGNGGVSHPVTKTYTINNIGTADLNLGTDAVSASGDTAFEVGLQPDAVVSAGGSTTFTIVFTAPAENTFNSEVQINSDDADEGFYTFDVTGVGIPAAPSQQASNIIASNIMDNSVDLSWTFGNGWGTVVAMYEGTDPFPAPIDNTTYIANTVFGAGDDIGGGWHVVYVGTGTSVSVTGLNSSSQYTVAAVEFYGNPGSELYNVSTETNNPINFTTTGADITPPNVTNLSPSLGTIIDGDTQLDITITFDEAMDTGIDPTISFPVEDPSNTLTYSGGLWDDNLNFTGSYLISDVDELLSNIDVRVNDAQDAAGNLMSTYDAADVFNIDTENPTITIDTYATSITSPQLTGTIDDANATIDIEVDGSNYAATNNADGTWTLAAGQITSLADATYDVIATATDQSGNIGTDGTSDELIISQTVVTLPAEDITSTSFTARWSEGLDVQTYQIDVSTVADFSTFVSGFQGTQIVATSITVDNLDFSSEYYYRVRLVNTSSQVSANSNTTVVKTIVDAETLADSVALRQIYDAINPQSLNWETDRLRDWIGVNLDAANRTRVEVVDINGTSAAGDMPNPFTAGAVGGLTNLLQMNVSNNDITGLMDYSATTINDLNVSANQLEFDDLEPLVGITTLDYSNQASVQFNEAEAQATEVRYNTDYTLSVSTGGSNNVYTWFRNDSQIASGDDFIVNGATNVILAIDYDNMGTFRAEVTSSLVPGLTIDIDAQDVLAVADIVMRLTDSDDVLLTNESFDGALLEAIRRTQGYDTLESAANVSGEFVFTNVVLGDYLCGIDPENGDAFIPTYFGDAFQWEEAEVILLRNDSLLTIRMTEVPPVLGPGDGDGNLDVLIEEDFGDDAGRVDARRRAAKRKCGLRRKRSGGRTGQNDDEFELIAYGETDDNGEFQFGFLPQGTYRFFVEYPGIPLDDSSFVEFEVGEAGVSDTDFKLQAFATEDGIEISIEAVLGVILEYFKDLEIYPNPSSEYLNIRYRHLKSGDVTAQLVDLAGNTKWSEDLRNGFDGQLRIDVTDFEEGIYILRFYDRESPQDNVVSFRVMVKD